MVLFYLLQKKKEDELDGKRKKEGMNLVIPFVPSADNSNLSADGDDSFISVDSAMPSPFSEVRLAAASKDTISVLALHAVGFLPSVIIARVELWVCGKVRCRKGEPWK